MSISSRAKDLWYKVLQFIGNFARDWGWLTGAGIVAAGVVVGTWYWPGSPAALLAPLRRIPFFQHAPAVSAEDFSALRERVNAIQESNDTSLKSQAKTAADIAALAAQFKDMSAELASTEDALAASGKAGSSPAASPSGAADSGPLNINQANSSQLDDLPGIGPTYAERIVKYREEHGPFASVDDLQNVSGIGQKTIDKIRDQITV